jgi:hypothetical protein
MRLGHYVANIDAHTESNAPVFHIASCKLMNAALELNSSANSLDRAREFRQEPVASVLHDAAAMLGDGRVDNLRQERSQFGVRSLFVVVHEPRVTRHVSGQDRR